jgi:cell division septal protein FtsQ
MSSQKIIDLRNAKRKHGRRINAPPTHKDKRVVPLRVRRQRTRIIMSVVGLALIVASVYAIHRASYLPRYTISQIEVTGTHEIDASLIKNYAEEHIKLRMYGFISHANIFLYNTKSLAHDMEKSFSRIKSANVSRKYYLATAIVVNVEERQPYALWCKNAEHPMPYISSDCYLLDDQGFIFAQMPDGYNASSTQSGYVFAGGAATSSDTIGQIGMHGHLTGIITLLQALSAEGFTPHGASIDTESDFSVPLSQGFYIKASFGEDADTLAKNLQLILSSDALKTKTDQLEYVDLRFGNRVYFKLKGEAQSASSTRQ